jgi:ankyrin repeat protein
LLLEYPEALALDHWKYVDSNPLHLACLHDRPDLVELIMKHNPSLLNSVNHLEETPLQIACKKEFGHIIDILFQYPHLDVNKIINQESGKTVLHDASWKMIPKLLQYNGINVDIRDEYTKTPFQCYLSHLNEENPKGTLKKAKFDIIKMYISKYPWVINAECKGDKSNVFHYIAEWQNIDILKAVYPYAADKINEGNHFKITPFHVVCGALKLYREDEIEVNIEFLDWFLNNKLCDFNLRAYNGFTALHYACNFHNVMIVEKLLQLSNIILDFYDKFGETPMHKLFRNIKLEDSDIKRTLFLQSALTIYTLMIETGVQVTVKNKKSLRRDKKCLSILDEAIELQETLEKQSLKVWPHRTHEARKENLESMNRIVDTIHLYENKRREKQFIFLLNEWYCDDFFGNE